MLILCDFHFTWHSTANSAFACVATLLACYTLLHTLALHTIVYCTSFVCGAQDKSFTPCPLTIYLTISSSWKNIEIAISRKKKKSVIIKKNGQWCQSVIDIKRRSKRRHVMYIMKGIVLTNDTRYVFFIITRYFYLFASLFCCSKLF